MNENVYELFYSVENHCDGSASPLFFVSVNAANTHQRKHNEDGNGWAEDCTGGVQIVIINEAPHLKRRVWIKEIGDSKDVTEPLHLVTNEVTIDKDRFERLLKIEKQHLETTHS